MNSHSTLRSIIKEGTLELCHLHLVLSTCLIALVVVVVNITKSKNIIFGHVDNTPSVINPQRMREGYSTHFVCLCVCVSLTALEATLIYSAKNGHQ